MTFSEQYQKDGFLRLFLIRFFQPASSMPQLKAWMLYAQGSTIPDIRQKTPDGTPATIPQHFAKLKCRNLPVTPSWTWSRIPPSANSPPKSQEQKWCKSGGCNCSTNPWANPRINTSPTSVGIRTATTGEYGKTAANSSLRGLPSATSHPMQDQCALSPDHTVGVSWISTSAFNNKTSTHCATAYQYPNRPSGEKFPCSCPPAH